MFRVNYSPQNAHSWLHDPSWERSSLQGALDLVATLSIMYKPGRWCVRDAKGYSVAKVNTTDVSNEVAGNPCVPNVAQTRL